MSAWMILGLSVCAVPVLTQLPERNPVSEQAWEAYTRLLSQKLFPHRAAFIESLTIRILAESDALSARANLDTHREIQVTAGIIRLVENEAEYASVVAHEVGHCVLKHIPASLFGGGISALFPGIPDDTDFELLAKQELAADGFSRDVLRKNGYDPCAAFRVRERLNRISAPNKNPRDPYNAIRLKRYEFLKTGCASFLPMRNK